MGGTFTVSLIDRAQTTSAATTLNRILNEVEGEVKSKMSVTEGAAGGAVRVSDRVLEMELCVVWEADKKWSTGIDLSEGTKEIRLEFKVVSRVFLLSLFIPLARLLIYPRVVRPLKLFDADLVLFSLCLAFVQDSSNLDLESILLEMVRKHANGLVRALYRKTFTHPSMAVLYDLAGGDIVLEQKGSFWPFLSFSSFSLFSLHSANPSNLLILSQTTNLPNSSFESTATSSSPFRWILGQVGSAFETLGT